MEIQMDMLPAKAALLNLAESCTIRCSLGGYE